MKKSIEQWLTDYGESHQNRVNKIIHWICVPIITWTVIALLWSVKLGEPFWLNLGAAFMVFAFLFYARLSISVMLGMLAFSFICVALILLHERYSAFALWQSALVIFVLAWIGQFVGHKIEGKKPSFFKDLQFLLIGPAWLISFIYKRLGIAL